MGARYTKKEKVVITFAIGVLILLFLNFTVCTFYALEFTRRKEETNSIHEQENLTIQSIENTLQDLQRQIDTINNEGVNL